MTTLSIVIPAYNMALFLRAAVESALDQTMCDLEVIVVNDGSTDETMDVLGQIQRERRDDRLHLIHQPNRGLAAARNAGIMAASGRHIGFLDADDIWDCTKAAKHIAVMEGDAAIGFTFSLSECIGEQGQRLGLLAARRSEPTLHDLIRRNYVGNGSALIARQECFDVAGLFNENMRGHGVEDYEMWCRILHDTGLRAVLIPEPLTLYRFRDSSMSTDLGPYMQNAEAAIASLRARMPEVPRRIFREGQAEHYRHGAWKAAMAHRPLLALRYFTKALRSCPWLFYYDWRGASVTMAAILLPRDILSKIVMSVRARRRFAELRT
jgi:glycosyltransferase involved in cell wall biosynthesis